MVIKSFFILLIATTTLLLCSNCSSNKGHSEKAPSFITSEANYVEIIAGEKDKAKILKLSFTVSELQENSTIDSVYFRETKSKVSIDANNDMLLITCELSSNLKSDLPSGFENLNKDEAYVFYTINKKHYFYKLINIIEKERIYLP